MNNQVSSNDHLPVVIVWPDVVYSAVDISKSTDEPGACEQRKH